MCEIRAVCTSKSNQTQIRCKRQHKIINNYYVDWCGADSAKSSQMLQNINADLEYGVGVDTRDINLFNDCWYWNTRKDESARGNEGIQKLIWYLRRLIVINNWRLRRRYGICATHLLKWIKIIYINHISVIQYYLQLTSDNFS
ncbi:Hypothetical_protein [Hexamita inflata]|uniref:Hypothetical_protein n=1 Tax=Hexamita inflata TaxID=28002 RepID=A0AA86QZH1_9EUKA|nr:Hypothetical protein HINF_LOCUS56571 [Hexamita inflata]